MANKADTMPYYNSVGVKKKIKGRLEYTLLNALDVTEYTLLLHY